MCMLCTLKSTMQSYSSFWTEKRRNCFLFSIWKKCATATRIQNCICSNIWFFGMILFISFSVDFKCARTLYTRKKTHWNAIAQTWNNGQKERTKKTESNSKMRKKNYRKYSHVCVLYDCEERTRTFVVFMYVYMLKRKGNRERERAPKKEQNLTETFWTRVLFEFLLKMWFSRMEWIFIHTSIQN